MLILYKKISKFLPAIFIFAIGIAIYSNSFQVPYHFDDFGYIKSNIAIRKLVDPVTFWNKIDFPARIVGFYTIALNYHFHGEDVLGYHIVNFTVHIINTFLVWWLVMLLMSLPRFENSRLSEHKRTLALLISLLFLTHPIQTQAVIYLSQRFASLATLFYLLSICLYLKGRGALRNCWVWFIVAGIAAIGGMLTKQITLTLPVMILLIEFLLIRMQHKGTPFFNIKRRYLLIILLFLLIIPAVYSFNVAGILSMAVDSGSHRGDDLTAGNYFLTQFRVIVTYIRLLFLPVHQNLLYDYPASHHFFEIPVILSFLFLSSILIFAVKLVSRYRLIAFGIFWFFITLSVESSVIVIRHVIFEHRVYLPSVGFFMAFCIGLFYLIKDDRVFVGLVSFLILICCLLTFQRNKAWQSGEALWKDVIRKSPEKSRPYMNLGIEYLGDGKLGQAIYEFTRALEKDPENERAYNNRGTAYVFTKQYDLALLDFAKAMKYDPSAPEAYINRGNTYSRLGRLDLAIADYEQAIKRRPESIEAHINRGNKYLKRNEYELAIADFTKVIEIDGKYVKAYQARGNTYKKMARYDLALQDYTQAIELDKKYTGAYYTRANIYAIQGDYDLMLADLATVIKLEPKHVNAYAKRGHIHLKLKKIDKALKDYNMVLSLNPKNAVVLYTRSLTYQALGQYREALIDAQKAESLGHSVGEKYLLQLKSRIGE